MITTKSVFIATLLLGMTVTQSVSGAPQELEATAGVAENPSDVTETTSALESLSPEPQNSNPKSAESVSEFELTKALLGNLSPEHMMSLGEMLEEDWKDRPEWGDMAVAILKDDFMRPGAGWWKPSAMRYDWNWLSTRFDANKDGKVERDELPGDVEKPEQLFERLDRDNDGTLMPPDFDYTAPNPATMLNIGAMKDKMSNQIFGRLDTNSNGRVTMDEIAEFFRNHDQEELGFLSPEDLRFALDDPSLKTSDSEPDEIPAVAGPSTPAAALKIFLRGDLGWLTAGPGVGDIAPDFTLPTHDGATNVTLSDSFGKRPVVLVFGSFT
jgi:Ca2+-binding EF-hand superfamily protein